MTNIDGNQSTPPPYLHVKHENTRKTGTKMIENTFFFSDRQDIENSFEV